MNTEGRPFIMYLEFSGDSMIVNCYKEQFKVELRDISTVLFNARPRQREQYYVARNGQSVYFPFLEEEIWITKIIEVGELIV